MEQNERKKSDGKDSPMIAKWMAERRSRYLPEGCAIRTDANREALATRQSLERAMLSGAILEGMVTLCDSRMRLHVDLGCMEGIIEPEDAVWCRAGEDRKDIAVISRVGKPACFRVLAIETRGGIPIARLSRSAAQQECLEDYTRHLRPGDILPARVTHMEPFGAFLDIGCGVSSLLSVDCVSVSRISHPRDRLACGELLPVVIKTVERESGRIYATLKELLGTWEENAAAFEAGQTVTGIIRSVENYGIFVELAPNLAGLAELRDGSVEDLKSRIGQRAAVYIKSIVPERMKIKLVLIDVNCVDGRIKKPEFFVDPSVTPHLSHWLYSPSGASKVVETCFDEPV